MSSSLPTLATTAVNSSLTRWRSAEVLASIATLAELRQQRILFVAGAYDEVIPVDAVRRLHEECGSADKTLVVLPVQHDYRDHPDQLHAVNRAVVDWLDTADRLPPATLVGDGHTCP